MPFGLSFVVCQKHVRPAGLCLELDHRFFWSDDSNHFPSTYNLQWPLSPQLFQCFILPHLRRLIDLGHSYGLKVQLHCCGGFAPLIPLMIEAGLDALHAVQPSCHGRDLKKLKADFGDKIVFNGAIDSHRILIEGTAETVRAETREVLDIMMPGGGFIAGASHDTIFEETPLENVLAMFDTIHEHGRYTEKHANS